MSFVIERVCGSARSGLFMGKLATPCLLPFTRKGLPPALIHDDLKTLDVQAVIVGAGDAFEQRRYVVQMVGAARGCWKA
jgi:queuine/archaeosine tRNA-ribosyltransferase